jgi:hypothetical protein
MTPGKRKGSSDPLPRELYGTDMTVRVKRRSNGRAVVLYVAVEGVETVDGRLPGLSKPLR